MSKRVKESAEERARDGEFAGRAAGSFGTNMNYYIMRVKYPVSSVRMDWWKRLRWLFWGESCPGRKKQILHPQKARDSGMTTGEGDQRCVMRLRVLRFGLGQDGGTA